MSEDTSVKEELNNKEQQAETPENVTDASEEQFQENHDGSETDLTAQLEIMTAKYNEEKDKYLRLYSDFENFRKQKIKERIELLQTANSDLVKQLLPVIDDFDRAVISNETIDDAETLREGFKLIHHKLTNILERQGLKEIEAFGKDFDTDLHEAITNIPATSDELKGKVMEVAEKGYFLNDKVIRFAKVIVGQ